MKKIVIEISDTLMEYIVKGRDLSEEQNDEMACAIVDGKPLPEHHGRLKDIDAFMTKVKTDRTHSAYLKSWTADDVLNALDNSYAPTIIEGSDA